MEQINQEAREIMFKPCPFCGNIPNVFQVPENRYGKLAKKSWFIQCVNMGCYCYKIEQPNTGDQSLRHAMEEWNERS